MAATDLTPFFQAVIQHLAMSPGGVTFIAKLGLDPNIKAAWTALNMSKSKKMATIIDTRPDLFSRFMTERAQPMVKLEAKGFECLAMGEIPPLGVDPLALSAVARMAAAAQSSSSSSSSCPPSGSGPCPCPGPILPISVGTMGSLPSAALPATPPPYVSPSEARKLFLRQVLDAVAARDGCVMELPQLGSVPEVQQAWKLSGLDRKLKMSDLLKERPDLVMVSVGDNGSAIVALTQLAIHCVQSGEVPDPDNSCPPPQQATKKKSSSGSYRPGGFGPMRGYGCRGGSGYSQQRYDPYNCGPPPRHFTEGYMGMMEGWGPPAGYAEAQSWYWGPQYSGW